MFFYAFSLTKNKDDDEDVKAAGICGTVKKTDFLKMIKTGEIRYTNILDVKLSSFN